MKDLTNSNIDRQNILNNRFALEKIQEYVGLSGMLFEEEYRFTTQMVTNFYGVDERTIKRYLENYEQELKHNGYILSKGKQLKDLKLQFGHVINVPSNSYMSLKHIKVIGFDADDTLSVNEPYFQDAGKQFCRLLLVL